MGLLKYIVSYWDCTSVQHMSLLCAVFNETICLAQVTDASHLLVTCVSSIVLYQAGHHHL